MYLFKEIEMVIKNNIENISAFSVGNKLNNINY